MSTEKIAETAEAQLDLVGDELLLTGKRLDAVKVRLRGNNPGAIGVYGWDFVFEDKSGAELGYLKMEIDDRYRDPAHPNYPTGMIEILLRKFAPGGSDDAEYVKVLRLRWDQIEALVPVVGFDQPATTDTDASDSNGIHAETLKDA